jgi:hypothetical protein
VIIEPMKKFKLLYYIFAFFALLIGIVLYAFFRNIDNLIIFQFIEKPVILSTLSIDYRPSSFLGNIIIYNLPDGLWCLSLLLLIRAVWINHSKSRMIYSGIFIVAAIVIEVAQLPSNIHGTFDVLDLLSYGFFAFVESLIFKLFIKRRITT